MEAGNGKTPRVVMETTLTFYRSIIPNWLSFPVTAAEGNGDEADDDNNDDDNGYEADDDYDDDHNGYEADDDNGDDDNGHLM